SDMNLSTFTLQRGRLACRAACTKRWKRSQRMSAQRFGAKRHEPFDFHMAARPTGVPSCVHEALEEATKNVGAAVWSKATGRKIVEARAWVTLSNSRSLQ